MPRQVGHVRPCETIWNNDLKFVSAGWCTNFTALNTSSHPAPLKSKVAVGAMLQECLRPLKSNAKERLMNRRTHKVWRVEQMNPHVHQLLQTVRQPYVTLTIFVSTLYTICQKKGSDFAVWKSPSTSNKIFRGSPSNFNILEPCDMIVIPSSQDVLIPGAAIERNCIRLPSGLWLWVLLLSAPPTSYTDLARWCGCM